MYVTAIVLAAGKGLRLKAKAPKPLIKIGSLPLIVYCLNALCKHAFIREVIVVTNPKALKGITEIIKKYRLPKVKKIILGGRLRQDSVLNGLKAIDRRTQVVLVHDAARPFIDKDTVSPVIRQAWRYGAAIAGVPVKATIKRVAPACRTGRGSGKRVTVEETLDRNNLWEIQTPQVFKKALILKAYEKFNGNRVTDDAALVEKLGHPVKIVRGSYFNIKITTPEDLVLAQAIAKNF